MEGARTVVVVARVGAEIIDGIVLTALTYGLGYVLGFPFDAGLQSDFGFIVNRYDLLIGLYLLATAVYVVPVMTLTDGQTLGNRAVRIRVVRSDLDPMTTGVAALREVALKAAVGSLFWPVYVLDVLWPLRDNESRALHDLVARTRVIRGERVHAQFDGPPPQAR